MMLALQRLSLRSSRAVTTSRASRCSRESTSKVCHRSTAGGTDRGRYFMNYMIFKQIRWEHFLNISAKKIILCAKISKKQKTVQTLVVPPGGVQHEAVFGPLHFPSQAVVFGSNL